MDELDKKLESVDQAHIGLGTFTVKVHEGAAEYEDEITLDENSEFVKLLRQCKKVIFVYRKLDGSTRVAAGTLKHDVVEKALDNVRRTTGKKTYIPQSGKGHTVYWDLEAEPKKGAVIGDFRTYISTRLVKVTEIWY